MDIPTCTCTCDKCSEEFVIAIESKKVVIKTTPYILNYFVCSECGEVYTICLDNKSIIGLKKTLGLKEKSLIMFGHTSKKLAELTKEVDKIKRLLTIEYQKTNKILENNKESCLLLIRQ